MFKFALSQLLDNVVEMQSRPESREIVENEKMVQHSAKSQEITFSIKGARSQI